MWAFFQRCLTGLFETDSIKNWTFPLACIGLACFLTSQANVSPASRSESQNTNNFAKASDMCWQPCTLWQITRMYVAFYTGWLISVLVSLGVVRFVTQAFKTRQVQFE